MGHVCPECGDSCGCVQGDVVERHCVHCDDALEDDDWSDDEDEFEEGE
jgi:hypothetical protein